MKTAKLIAKKLTLANKTLAIAESCTGGLASDLITDIPGSSKFFKLSIVAYNDLAKAQLLKVPKSLINRYGAVSPCVARVMSENIKNLYKADFGLAITGIAGPTGQTPTKPVGLVYISLSTPFKTICKKFNLKGSRLQIKKASAEKALGLLYKNL